MDYQKKAFEVEISNGGPRGYETAITLKLPATWAEFHDALQKARIPDGRNCGIELTRSWWAGLSSDLIGGAKNLYELNLFARRLTMLTSVELLSMDGLLKMEQAQGTKSIPLPRLINLTFNADCHIKDRLSEANRNWQRGAYIPQDGTNRYFAVDTALICMDQFISQVRDAYKQLELLGPEHCESGSYEKLDYEGRVLVLAPDTLKESYWNQRSQLWLAHDGFGCTPGAIGRSIRCTCLGDGEETRWNRTDFIGVLKEECLPQWAAEALSKLTEGKEQSHTQGGMTMQ